MVMNKNEKYDQFGVLSSIPWQDIKNGDSVEYFDTKRQPGPRGKTYKVSLKGIWDGEKVCFDDNEKTIIRTTRWLNKL